MILQRELPEEDRQSLKCYSVHNLSSRAESRLGGCCSSSYTEVEDAATILELLGVV